MFPPGSPRPRIGVHEVTNDAKQGLRSILDKLQGPGAYVLDGRGRWVADATTWLDKLRKSALCQVDNKEEPAVPPLEVKPITDPCDPVLRVFGKGKVVLQQGLFYAGAEGADEDVSIPPGTFLGMYTDQGLFFKDTSDGDMPEKYNGDLNLAMLMFSLPEWMPGAEQGDIAVLGSFANKLTYINADNNNTSPLHPDCKGCKAHSMRKANAQFRYVGVVRDDGARSLHIAVVSTRHIRRGSQVLVSYGAEYFNDPVRMRVSARRKTTKRPDSLPLDREGERLRAVNAVLSAQLEAAQRELAELRGRRLLADTGAELGETKAKLADTKASLAEAEAKLAETKASLAEAEANLAETKAKLAKSTAEIDAKLAEIKHLNVIGTQKRNQLKRMDEDAAAMHKRLMDSEENVEITDTMVLQLSKDIAQSHVDVKTMIENYIVGVRAALLSPSKQLMDRLEELKSAQENMARKSLDASRLFGMVTLKEHSLKEARQQLADVTKQLHEQTDRLDNASNLFLLTINNINASNQKQLGQVRHELGEARQELGEAKQELGEARQELGQAKQELGQAKQELGQAKQELGQVRQELGQVRQELGDVKREQKERAQEAEKKLAAAKQRAKSDRHTILTLTHELKKSPSSKKRRGSGAVAPDLIGNKKRKRT